MKRSPAEAKAPPATAKAPRRQQRPAARMSGPDREQQIVAGAIRFFAEVGLAGNTRDLAERLGITQPLLYRYFPTKQLLLERVYADLFFNRLNRNWRKDLQDRSRPLLERMCAFYAEYAAVQTYEWIRLYMSIGLAGSEINARYIQQVEQEILVPMCNEIRVYCGLPDQSVIPISRAELEHVWVFHGGLFYYAIRKHIYHAALHEDFDTIVDRATRALLQGIRAITGTDGGDRPRIPV